MKLRFRLAASVFVALSCGWLIAWKWSASNRATTHVTAPRPSQVVVQSDGTGLALERDGLAVFQRAFWRRPATDDIIIQAERRDWLGDSSAVRRWQWFVAVRPSDGFRDWLLKENPFELIVVARGNESAAIIDPPSWFPVAAELANIECYRNSEGRLLVFYDMATNRLFATDSGNGLAGASR